jgi:hypothetical protein
MGFMNAVRAVVDGIRVFFRALYATPPGCCGMDVRGLDGRKDSWGIRR